MNKIKNSTYKIQFIYTMLLLLKIKIAALT